MNDAWFDLYSAWAETPAEAREALAALPAYLPLPPKGTVPLDKGNEGRVYALTGDVDRAIPLLRAEAAWCGLVQTGLDPVANYSAMAATSDRLILGQMLEQKSDRDGACAQYAAIIARWGKAKPRSITADKARARSKALGCQ